MNEFNLSEKRSEVELLIRKQFYKGFISSDKIGIIEKVLKIVEEQDKEFIRRLKEESFEDINFSYGSMICLIDKLAGEFLE